MSDKVEIRRSTLEKLLANTYELQRERGCIMDEGATAEAEEVLGDTFHFDREVVEAGVEMAEIQRLEDAASGGPN